MPNATVVADIFHVMKQINEELDQQTKAEKRAAEKEKSKKKKEKILSGLVKSKYALLKNKCNLNEKQKSKLDQVKKVCPTLGKMHELKEKFRDIFEKSQDGITGLLKEREIAFLAILIVTKACLLDRNINLGDFS